MAGISTLSGFDYNGGQYGFSRDGFKTLQEMFDFPERYMPPMHIALNEEDGNLWIYNTSNIVTDTGKWRIFTGGMSELIDYYKKSETDQLLNNKVDKEDGKILSSNDYTTLEKEKLATLENYDDTDIRTHITASEQAIIDIQTSIGNTPLATTEQSLTGAIVEIKNACDTKNAETLAKATANEEAIAIINGDSTVSGSIKKSASNTLKDAQRYCDQKISEMSANSAINCEQKPVYFDDGSGTIVITYIKNGTSMTTDDLSTWFYYTQDGKLMQTIFIKDTVDGTITENSVVSAGETNFQDFVSKTDDVVSTYDGDEADTSKIGDLGALQALEAKVNANIDTRVKISDVVDSLDNTSTNPLSANQGRVLNESINTKLNKTFTGDDVANKHLATDSMGNVVLSAYDDTLSDTSTNAVQNKAIKTALDTKLDKVQDIANAGKVLSVGEDGTISFTDAVELGGTADKVAYENEDYPDLINVSIALKNILDKVYYTALQITSFTCNVADTHEIGTVLTDISFSWSYNKDIKSQALTDCSIVIDDREAIYAELTTTKSFVLTASDGSGNTGSIATATKKISFLPRVYYGCTNAEEITNDVVLGLSNSKLTSTVKGSYAFNCGSGEFAYIVAPKSQSFNGNIWVNGFQAEMEKVSTISITNASNYTQAYDVWRFSNSGLGSFTGEVK